MTRTCLTNIKKNYQEMMEELDNGATHSTAIENVWRAG